MIKKSSLQIAVSLLAFALPVFVQADSHTNQKDIASLHKGEWLTVEVDGTNAAEESNHTMTIAADNTVTGHTGCNAYTAVAVIDGVDLMFKDISVGDVMCTYMVQQKAEKEFLAALKKAAAFDVNVNVMRIYDADTKEVLKLRRMGTVIL